MFGFVREPKSIDINLEKLAKSICINEMAIESDRFRINSHSEKLSLYFNMIEKLRSYHDKLELRIAELESNQQSRQVHHIDDNYVATIGDVRRIVNNHLKT